MFERIKNKNLLKPSLFIALTLILTAVAIALRTINLSFFFDYDIGYYQRGAALPMIMNILFVASILFFAIASIFLTKLPDPITGREKNPLTIVGSSLCALTFLAMGINFLLYHRALIGYVDFTITVIGIYAVISFLSAIYFIFNIFNFIRKYRALFAIPVIGNFICAIAISYFNITVPMNSPQKILLHISCLASTFFIITEARSIFENVRKRLYIFWLCAGVFFTGVYSVPSLISFAIDGIKDYNFIAFIIIVFSMFVYLVMRAVTVIIGAKKSETSNVVGSAPQAQEEENI